MNPMVVKQFRLNFFIGQKAHQFQASNPNSYSPSPHAVCAHQRVVKLPGRGGIAGYSRLKGGERR